MNFYLDDTNLGPFDLPYKTTLGELKKSLNSWSEENNLGLVTFRLIFNNEEELSPVVFTTDKYDKIDFTKQKDLLKRGKIIISRNSKSKEGKRAIKSQNFERDQTNIGFTGNKNIDTLILSLLNDKDLVNACKTSKNIREICKNDTFWMNRTISRFSPIISLEDLQHYQKQFKTWKEYYIDLVDTREGPISHWFGRLPDWSSEGWFKKDRIAVATAFNNNNNELIHLLKEKSYSDIKNLLMKTEFVNPNVIFQTDGINNYTLRFFPSDFTEFKETFNKILEIIKDDSRFDLNDLFRCSIWIADKKKAQEILDKISSFFTVKELFLLLLPEAESKSVKNLEIFLYEAVKLGAKKNDIEEFLLQISSLPKKWGSGKERKENISIIKKFLRKM